LGGIHIDHRLVIIGQEGDDPPALLGDTDSDLAILTV
jgi:hypothetical protein